MQDGWTGTITANGKTLEAAWHGPGPADGPVIVMLHEGLGSVSAWKDVPAKLAAATGLGVFVYSRAGYGQSETVELPRPLDYMEREAMDVLPDVLEAIGASRVILLGHSDGATIAATYGGMAADQRVRGVILVAPHFFTEPVGLAAIAAAKEAYETGDLRARLAKHHKDVDTAFWGWNGAWLDPEFEEWHVGEVIDYLRIPALVIQGDEDPYGTRAQVEEVESRSYAPVDVEMLQNCRHAPHFEQPEATIAAISEFCARLVRIENEVVVPA